MDREEILAMEAGRGLDREVALVLGYYVVDYVFVGPIYHSTITMNYGEEESELPHYSADISAAWQVVRQMMKDGYSYFSNYGDNEKWGVTYAHTIGDLVWADTIEEAICKAALLAKLEAN